MRTFPAGAVVACRIVRPFSHDVTRTPARKPCLPDERRHRNKHSAPGPVIFNGPTAKASRSLHRGAAQDAARIRRTVRLLAPAARPHGGFTAWKAALAGASRLRGHMAHDRGVPTRWLTAVPAPAGIRIGPSGSRPVDAVTAPCRAERSSPPRPRAVWHVMNRHAMKNEEGADRVSADQRLCPEVPPAGFEPAHTAPEAVALSPELRGRFAGVPWRRGKHYQLPRGAREQLFPRCRGRGAGAGRGRRGGVRGEPGTGGVHPAMLGPLVRGRKWAKPGRSPYVPPTLEGCQARVAACLLSTTTRSSGS